METKTLTRLTVGEMLTTCNLKVKIGSKEGGGFVFCGNVAEVDLMGIDREIIDDMKASRNRAQREITSLKNRPKDFEAFVSEMERKRKQYARKLGGGSRLSTQQKRNSQQARRLIRNGNRAFRII